MLDSAIGLLAGEGSFARALQLIACLVIALPVIYLFQLNRLLSGTPEEVRKLSPTRWTKELLLETYARLSENPITIANYADQLPPKLERRYIVTGGSGTWPTQPVTKHVFQSLTCQQGSSAATSSGSCSHAANLRRPSAFLTSSGPTGRICSAAPHPR
jgi:hypothetical protein